jgi:DNA ligase-1
MRALAVLTEELESRPADADRVDALARHLRAVGRRAGALAGEWLVASSPGARPQRPARLTQAALADAAQVLAERHGMAAWLFEAGRAAGTDAAEAIALLLPWPDGAPSTTSRPSLADWQARWTAAAAQPPDARAVAIAATIARLDDAITRRWAVRAVCGLGKPLVDAWQWQRAWARAFDADHHAVAWWWHRARGTLLLDVRADAVPRPSEFTPLADAPEALHDELLRAWRSGELRAEPRWPGVRVHVVRRGDDVAVWQRGGGLLNASLPPAWLAVAAWPDGAVIEAVLFAWRARRVVALADAWPPRPRASATGATLHLALIDWHGNAEAAGPRRARLHARWPAPALADLDTPPAIFTMPALPRPDAAGPSDLAALADAARVRGWSGLVLRHAASRDAWAVRARVHRVHAVLQYVPTDALAAGAAAANALAVLACGFALWNRAPRSEEERGAAMTAAMSGQFLPPPDDAGGVEGLRLLPLARLAIDLPGDELLRLHTWLRANAGLRFGGVHAVAPMLVFELGFAAAHPSRRHKIGATLASARVLRWLHDAAPGAAQLAADLFPGA